MSRRSSRKTDVLDKSTKIAANGLEETVVSVTSQIKKSVKNEVEDAADSAEDDEVITKPKKSPAKSKTKSKKELDIKAEVEDDAADSAEDDEVITKPKKSPAKSKAKSSKIKEPESDEEPPAPKKAAKGKRKAKAEEEVDGDAEEKKVVKKRKTKEEKEQEAEPLASRTDVSTLKKQIFIGAHVSASGGVDNSIQNSLHVGANSFALFLKNQQRWSSKALEPDVRDKFLALCKEHNYDQAKHCLPHGSYLVNLAQADPDKAGMALNCFIDDLQRCEALGIKLYNFHPGSSGSNPRPEAITRIAKALNKAHAATSSVITVIENMAGAGNIIGSTWEDLRDIIAQVDDKSRVGVCIDTCHTFAAGHDLRTPEAFKKTLDAFSSIVGMEYLKALHLNDSKAPFASNRDLHANIGTGFLGLRAFHSVVNFEPFQNLPMVLETPIDKKGPDGKTTEDKGVWATEIKLLEGLLDADVESEEFKAMEKRLQDQGADERKRVQEQVDKKAGKSKGQKSITSMFKPVKGKKKGAKDAEEDAGESDGEGCSH